MVNNITSKLRNYLLKFRSGIRINTSLTWSKLARVDGQSNSKKLSTAQESIVMII